MFRRAFRSLHFAVRPRVVAKYTGQILLAHAALALVPASVSLLGAPAAVGWLYLVVIALFALVGGAAARLSCTTAIQTNEALVVSALAFVLPGIAMALPLLGFGIAPIDALFDSISGITTTGLSTLADVENLPAAFHFGRAWLQWIGGLGTVVLVLALVLPSSLAAKRLGFDSHAESELVGSTRTRARGILVVYVLLTALGWVLCKLAGLEAATALELTLSAISTGGFAPRNASLADFTPLARTAVSVVCLLGAVSFFWFLRLSPRTLRHALRDRQVSTLVVLVALGAVPIGCALANHGLVTGREAVWQSLWMSISAQTTAGFATLAPADLPDFALVTVGLQMLIGGEVGSTAGGLKILRTLILGKLFVNRMLRASMPARSELSERLNGQTIRPAEIEGAATLALVLLAFAALFWLAFLAYGHEPLASLFDVVSALGTVGLSAGVTGPELEAPLKLVLCTGMLLGRLEVFALLILVFPVTWIGRKRSAQ